MPALRAAVQRPILLLAEWGDLKMHRFGFDLTYAWDSYSRLKAVWKGAPADTLRPAASWPTCAPMPPGGMRMRFTTNHDETAWDNPPVTLFGGAAGARAAFVAMALLPGRPLLYDGQEVESPQKLGLFVRDPIVWNQPDAAAARAFYRRVLQLARTDPAFLRGGFPRGRDQRPARRDRLPAGRRGGAGERAAPRVRFTVTGVAVDGVARPAVGPRPARRHGHAAGLRGGRCCARSRRA